MPVFSARLTNWRMKLGSILRNKKIKKTVLLFFQIKTHEAVRIVAGGGGGGSGTKFRTQAGVGGIYHILKNT